MSFFLASSCSLALKVGVSQEVLGRPSAVLEDVARAFALLDAGLEEHRHGQFDAPLALIVEDAAVLDAL
eukprot:6021808-Pyramimonas_sp.AAC.1